MSATGQVPDTERLADHLAIQDVIFKHCRGLDRADAVLLKTCYWEDAQVDYGFFKGGGHEFCDLIARSIVGNRATHHQVSNIIPEFSEDEAVVESYVTAYHHQPGGQLTEMTYMGRYIDHMEKRDNVWKLLMRHVVADWNQNLVSSDNLDSGPLSSLAKSARMPDDPLYEQQEKILGVSE